MGIEHLRFVEEELGLRPDGADEAFREARIIQAIRVLAETNTRFMTANDSLRVLIRKYRQALDRTRWSWHDSRGTYCLFCKRTYMEGHTADCPVVVLLGSATEDDSPTLPANILDEDLPTTDALGWCIQNSSLNMFSEDAREELRVLYRLAMKTIQIQNLLKEGVDE